MKKQLLIVCVILICCQSIADTYVGGMITEDTTWVYSNSPYVASQSVLVMNGATLSIGPGVEVRFDPDTALSITEGTLKAIGTDKNNIVFTANISPKNVESNRWGGVGFENMAADAMFDDNGNWTNGCILKYVVIEYAGGEVLQGAIDARDCSVLIDSSVVQSNSVTGIYLCDHNGTIIRNCLIQDNYDHAGGGIWLTGSYDIKIVGNSILRNISNTDGGGIWITRTSPPQTYNISVISNNISYNSALSGAGISVASCSNLFLTYNTISYNSASFRGGGLFVHLDPSDMVSIHNDISYNSGPRGSGICCSGGSRMILSADPDNPTRIYGNDGSAQVYSSAFFTGPNVYDNGNVDARNVYWGATNESEVQSMIFDFMDDSSRGIVFYDPWLSHFDFWRTQYGLTTNDTEVMDRDSDNTSNWEEFIAGTDPTNSLSVFAINNIFAEDNQVVIEWNSSSDRLYTLWGCSNLVENNWYSIRDDLVSTEPINVITNIVSNALVYYKISVNKVYF